MKKVIVSLILFAAMLFCAPGAFATQTTTINFQFFNTLTKVFDLTTGEDRLSYKKTIKFTDGAGANQSEAIFHDKRTLSASGSEDLNLAGVLADPFGTTLTFTKIKAIAIYAHTTNTNNVVVGGHATAAFAGWVNDATDKVVIKPGGLFVIVDPTAAGYAVTATTADLLTIANSAGGTGVDYDIVILGATS